MKILIQFPSRDRFEKLCDTTKIYIEKATNLNNIIFNFSIDKSDTQITKDKLINYLKQYQNVNYLITVSDNNSKIQAVNRIPDVNFDIILLASDDMVPIVNGYDSIIINKMLELYPDTDGVLWFNDGYVGTRLNTLSILGKKYYDRFGYIYNRNYISLWCDNEFMDVANKLNKQTYIDQCIIKHEHWANNRKYSKDPLYIKNDTFAELDKKTYYSRKAINFELKID